MAAKLMHRDVRQLFEDDLNQSFVNRLFLWANQPCPSMTVDEAKHFFKLFVQHYPLIRRIAERGPIVQPRAMDFNTYQKISAATMSFSKLEAHNVPPLLYCMTKLAGEVGELAEKIGKCYRDQGPPELLPMESHRCTDSASVLCRTGHCTMNGVSLHQHFIDGVKKEAGDCTWYIAAICTLLGIDFQDVAEANVAKLADRKARGVLHGEGDNR